jgi:HK97 family phage portal protein
MSLAERVWGALNALRSPHPSYLRRFSVPVEALATARPPISGRLLDWQTTTPQYPPANFRTFTTFGYRHNTVFRRCVDVLGGAACQARVTVVERGTARPMPLHPMLRVFREPAPRVTEKTLWKRFIQDGYTTGNAIWEKVRAVGSDEVVELWRMEPGRTAIEPDQNGVPRRYLYSIMGKWWPIPAENILHWKFPDPLQPYFGIPPIYSAFRDLSVDNELIDHFKVTLQNLAVPAVVLEHEEAIEEEEAEEARRKWKMKYGGFRKGEPAVVGGGTKVNVIGMDMQKMAISELISTSESRIAMVHGVPMMLLGRSGTLADPTRANYAEAKEHFYTDTVLPLLSEIAEELTAFLLSEWEGADQLEAMFDTTGIPVLQEAKLRRGTAASKLFTDGLVSRHESQRLAGVAVHGPDVFYRSSNIGGIVPADAQEEVLELTEA